MGGWNVTCQNETLFQQGIGDRAFGGSNAKETRAGRRFRALFISEKQDLDVKETSNSCSNRMAERPWSALMYTAFSERRRLTSSG